MVRIAVSGLINMADCTSFFVFAPCNCDLLYCTALISLAGICVAAKLNRARPAHPFILQEIFTGNNVITLACRTTVFRDNHSIFDVPDEEEYEKCYSKYLDCTNCMSPLDWSA